MSFFDTLNKAVNAYSEAASKERQRIEKTASSKYRELCRNSSDEALYHNLRKYEDNGNYIAVEEIKRELRRRGLDDEDEY